MNKLVARGIGLMAYKELSAAKLNEHTIALDSAFPRFAINTPDRICAALAQFAHETGGFQWMRELGGSHYFQMYEGRKSLGNTQPGDGARFPGRGYIGLTGRTNYYKMAKAFPEIPLMDHPELAEVPQYSALFSCKWWQDRGLNELADAHKFQGITRRINGGMNGYADRKARYDILLKLATELEKSE